MKRIIFIVLTILISTTSFSQEKKYATYRVTDNETIISISKKLGITPLDLLRLNPDASDGIDIDEVLIIPNKNYNQTTTNKPITTNKSTDILVKETVNRKNTFKDSIKDGVLYHRVKFGETIYSLSKKYKVKKKKVLKLNKLKKRSKISIGQLLKFPTKKDDTVFEDPNIVVQAKNEFINYTVKAQETKYSIGRRHHISVEELEELNPRLKNKTLNEYDVIILPNLDYKKEIITEVSNKRLYKTHNVQPQETFYKITNIYNVTKEELIDLNPELINGLKDGMQIKIPNKANEIILTEANIITHKVQPKETIFKLTQLYSISETELLALNPDLKDGLKDGMTLIVSKSKTEEKLLNLDENFEGKKLNVVLMLPFKAKTNGTLSFSNKKKENQKKIKNLHQITDFYLGAITAIEKLKKKGLSVNLKVYDTEGNKKKVTNIINSNDFSETDIIIGPLYFRNVTQVSKALANNKTIIISPVASNNHRILNASNIVQIAPTKNKLKYKVLDYIKQNYTNQNIVIVAEEVGKSNSETTSIINYLKLNPSIKKITVLNLEKGYIKRKKFENVISDKKENWVILASNERDASATTVDNLGVLTEKFNTTLFAFSKGNNFNGIKNSFLNRLNFHFPIANYLDEENIVEIKTFNQLYSSKYGTMPTDFVYRGYDITYDALIRTATYNNLKDSFQSGKTKGLKCNFNYSTTNFSNIYNKEIFIVKYDNYKIVKTN